MIGKLKGLIDEYADSYVLVDVNGVCYEVHCSNQTLAGACHLLGKRPVC